MSGGRGGNNQQPTMEQLAHARKLANLKELPRLGPKKRATHCFFYLFYGVISIMWSSGLYDWAFRSPVADTVIQTLVVVIFVWGIWDFATLTDSKE